MKVMDLYNRRLADPNFKIQPTTFIFSGKAASSYTFAKEVIRLINGVANVVNNDPRVNDIMKVLTSLTLVLSIPTLIASIWGMNVAVPFEGSSVGFWVLLGVSLLASVVSIIILSRRKML